jgi:hypothetical protein
MAGLSWLAELIAHSNDHKRVMFAAQGLEMAAAMPDDWMEQTS